MGCTGACLQRTGQEALQQHHYVISHVYQYVTVAVTCDDSELNGHVT